MTPGTDATGIRIAVASGKGGTGKTTIATNLVYVADLLEIQSAYVDCDVEEPNGHLFLQPDDLRVEPIHKLVPTVNLRSCTRCGVCVSLCQFNSLVIAGDIPLVFPELCHACGGCRRVCPSGAIQELPQRVGQRRVGHTGSIAFVDGQLDIGQHLSPPLIHAVKSQMVDAKLRVIDAPPGTSCAMVAAVRDADRVLLVAEPTPFGLHDLRLAVETVGDLELDCGVIINRAGQNDSETKDYCHSVGIPVVAELKDDRRVAEAYSLGQLAAEAVEGYRAEIEKVLSWLL